MPFISISLKSLVARRSLFLETLWKNLSPPLSLFFYYWVILELLKFFFERWKRSKLTNITDEMKQICYMLFSAVVVIQNATVHDLKKAIQRHISLKLSREGGPNIVSWYVVNWSCCQWVLFHLLGCTVVQWG